MHVKILVALLASSISIMVYSSPAVGQDKPSGEKFLDSRIDNRRIQDLLGVATAEGASFSITWT